MVDIREYKNIGGKEFAYFRKTGYRGFIAFVVGMIWKLVIGIPLGFWVTPPESLVVEWWAFTALHWAGFFLFGISLVYYFGRGRKAG